MSARPLALLGAALALGAAGCHHALRPPPPDLPADPAALLEALRAAQARPGAVEGRARLDVESPRGSGGVDQYLAAVRPDRVRVESLDFFGNVLSVLAVEGGRLALYDARERVFYRGPATAENMGRLAPVAVSPEALATLLCGTAPLLDGEPVEVAPGDGTRVLTLRRGDLLQRIEVEAGAAIRSVRLRRLLPDGSQVPAGLDATFSGRRTVGGVLFPEEVAASSPAEGVSLTLRWRQPTVGGTPDAALFRLEPPRGARVVDLGPSQP